MASRVARIYQRLDGHAKEVVNGASAAFALRMSGAALAVVLNIALGRMMGADGVGLYFLALSVVTIAMVLGRAGLDNTLLRFTAASAAAGDWAAVKGLYVKSIWLTLAASGFLAAAVIMLAPWLGDSVFSNPNLATPLRLMALAIVPTAVLTVVAQMLQGLRRTKDGIAVLSVWAPAFSLGFALLLVPRLGLQGAALAYTIAAILGALAAWWRWRRATPQLTRLHGVFATEKLLRSSIPLFWAALSQLTIALSPTIVLGMWSTSSDVGIYGVASRVVVLVSFLQLAVGSIASPKFSALYQQGDMPALATLAQSCTRLQILAATPLLAACWLAPEAVMGIFGSDFKDGATVVAVLAVGQLVAIAMGTAGNVLMMCGYERMVRNALVVSAFTCVAMTLLLVPRMGVVGAAAANAATLCIENLAMAALLWRTLGMTAFAFPFHRLRRALGVQRG